MGAARFPEQITERVEAGRRAMLEDQNPDPVIEKLKARRVKRVVEPEEKNSRRTMSAGARKGTRTIATKLALGRQLKALYHKIDTLRLSDPMVASGRGAVEEQIASLRQLARSLRRDIERLSSRKRSRKRKR